jgi:hypothetical protein
MNAALCRDLAAVSTASVTATGSRHASRHRTGTGGLVELVDFVERELQFKHPVPVQFLTERQFKRVVARCQGELSRQDRAGRERWAALLGVPRLRPASTPRVIKGAQRAR